MIPQEESIKPSDKPTKEQQPSPVEPKKTGQGKIVAFSQKRTMGMEFSGPMPPPVIMEGYEKVLPGAAERILKMAEHQEQHRHKMEKRIIFSETFQPICGMVFAFIIVLITFLGGAFLIYNNRPVGGLISIITAIGVIVISFIMGRKGNGNQPPPAKDTSSNP